jgi:acyl carrier protein
MKQGFLLGLAETLEVQPEDLTPDYKLEDSELWDSMTVVTVIAMIDEHYGRSASGEALMDCKTVADIEALVDKL